MRFYIVGIVWLALAIITETPSVEGPLWVMGLASMLTGMIFGQIEENEND